MSKPIIGVTFHKRIKDVYGAALEKVGGVPIYLAPCGQLDSIVRGLDGIVFSGGGDVWPGLFGEEITRGSGVPDPARDWFELGLAEKAVALSLPLLGICRGVQVINIALGGTVFQDIGRSHFQQESPITPTHLIDILPNSGLSQILKTTVLEVNSFHHQSIKDLAPALTPSAYSRDGIIEAVEGNNILGCQWHPEWLSHREAEEKIFSYFIRICKEYHDNSQKSQAGKTQ